MRIFSILVALLIAGPAFAGTIELNKVSVVSIPGDQASNPSYYVGRFSFPNVPFLKDVELGVCPDLGEVALGLFNSPSAPPPAAESLLAAVFLGVNADVVITFDGQFSADKACIKSATAVY